MLKRLLAALFEGVVPGAAVAYALSRLGVETTATMYAAVALVGVLTGLVAGRPIWARAAKTEGALKAVAGAFISVVVLYALRKWLPGVRVDLGALGAGALPIGSVPWVFLPAVGVALALVLEVDDAFGADPPAPTRVRAGTAGSFAPAAPEPESEEDEGADVAQARRGR
jgi:hypothetical protein